MGAVPSRRRSRTRLSAPAGPGGRVGTRLFIAAKTVQVTRIDLSAIWLVVVPLISLLSGQISLFYRFSRVGGGPGSYRTAIRERYKQYRSILVMDFLAGFAVIGVIAFVGPAGALAA